ncbi:MAG: KpsF/GutQ family sugar-phosphate isomerase [Candidatus Omnitrophica bacterium]|nr:KpsF/GutQ family sugar-phosphate isomerase [Candidatus Omnitrophota bacterium]
MTLNKAKEVIMIESKAISELAKRINNEFLKAVELIMRSKGRVIVTGMGKTGIIARKISATLSSTGTPSIWMHSAEALHGDLGQVTPQDVLIMISSSGETEETVRLLPTIKKIGAKTIAFTGNTRSSLAKYCDVVLDVSVKEEGCPLGLAPMASTTATLVMGDALAACLVVRRKFCREDFALFHPGGILGKKLLLTVEDIMRKGNDFSRVNAEDKVKDVLFSITKARCGSACIVDRKGALVGIFTDGDLRRKIESDPLLLEKKVKDVMTKNPTSISDTKLAAEAIELLEGKKIDELPVIDKNGKLVGLLDVQDLLKAGLI